MGKSKTTWQPGVRPEGAGRKKGTPNKKTRAFLELLEENDFDPGQAYVDLYRAQMDVYRATRDRELQIDALRAAGMSLNNICQFVYPKRKAIDHKVDVNELSRLSDDELDQRLKAIEKKLDKRR